MEPLKAKKQRLFSEWVLARFAAGMGSMIGMPKSWELLPPFY